GAVALAVGLAGCDSNSDDYLTANNAHAEANKLTLDQLNKEKETRSRLLAQLQQKDPSVKDVQFVLDEEGKRTVRVAREGEDGQIHTWQAPADAFSQAQGQSNPQDTSAGSGASGMLLAGMAGYLMGNMFSKGGLH